MLAIFTNEDTELVMDIIHFKEKTEDNEFNFKDISFVEIDWSDSLHFEPKLHDCSLNDAMSGFDIYVLCLNEGVFPDNRSLLYYNNSSNSDNSISGDFNTFYTVHPGYDQCFQLNPQILSQKYDEVIFVIGRPKTKNTTNINWIDHSLVKEVSDEICYVNCRLVKTLKKNMHINLKNIEFAYNKNGALILFRIVKTDENWKLDLSHHTFYDGLSELFNKYSKIQ